MSLISAFRRYFQVWRLPNNSEEVGNYASNFMRAIDFTRSCGFRLETHGWTGGNVVDGKKIEQAMAAAGVRNPKAAAGQCLKWSHYLAPWIEKQLGCSTWLTIGQLWKDNDAVFSPSWRDLKKWSRRGIQYEDLGQYQGINLHAWLTLETGEILDITLLSTLAAVLQGEYQELAGAAMWGRDPDMGNGHRYFPMAVGCDIAESIGTKSVVPLIARNPFELHHTAVTYTGVENIFY